MRKEFSIIHHKTEIYIHFTIISIALFIFIIIYQIYLTKSTQHTLHPFPFHNCSELYSFYTKISETNYHLWLKLLNSRSSYLKTEETEITEWHLNQEPHNSERSFHWRYQGCTKLQILTKKLNLEVPRMYQVADTNQKTELVLINGS
jgi:hypothetical protein